MNYAQLRAAVDENPKDWDLKLIPADYCEEESNDLEANFWRWCEKERKVPERSTQFPPEVLWGEHPGLAGINEKVYKYLSGKEHTTYEKDYTIILMLN